MITYLPFIFMAVVVVFIIYAALSKKGHNTVVTMMFGDIIQDYGELGSTKLKIGTQTTRLLKCQKDSDIFYVLETTDTMPTSKQTTWTKIDETTLNKILTLIKQP